MKLKEIFAAFLVISLAVVAGNGISLGVASLLRGPASQQLGSASDNVLPAYPTVSQAFVKSSDTTAVASSTGRQGLIISNMSGATTTAQVVTCNFGDRPATLYSGLSIAPSTTVAFYLDNLYRGALHCIAPTNGALLTITDF